MVTAELKDVVRIIYFHINYNTLQVSFLSQPNLLGSSWHRLAPPWVVILAMATAFPGTLAVWHGGIEANYCPLLLSKSPCKKIIVKLQCSLLRHPTWTCCPPAVHLLPPTKYSQISNLPIILAVSEASFKG